MPAYNEAENIEETVKQWYSVVEKLSEEGAISAILCIANDGSKDNTFEIMKGLQDKFPLFEPIDKPNSGHGATVLYLYRHAIANGANYIFQTDSDGQTNPDEFWQMWNNREKYEWVTDANTPFRLMRSDKLQPIMDVIPQDYFLCNVAISAIAVKWNYKIGWYKITFKPRQGGVNSINMKRIIKIGWKALEDFKKINRNLKK